MAGPEGNSDFCFLKTVNVPWEKLGGKLRIKEKQNSLFPMGPVIRWVLISSNSKIEQIAKNIPLMPAGTQICQGLIW